MIHIVPEGQRNALCDPSTPVLNDACETIVEDEDFEVWTPSAAQAYVAAMIGNGDYTDADRRGVSNFINTTCPACLIVELKVAVSR